VAKPTDAPASEIAKAQPVYIEGAVTTAQLDALANRVAALEAAASGAN